MYLLLHLEWSVRIFFQMLTTVVVLFVAKELKIISFPEMSRDIPTKVRPYTFERTDSTRSTHSRILCKKIWLLLCVVGHLRAIHLFVEKNIE